LDIFLFVKEDTLEESYRAYWLVVELKKVLMFPPILSTILLQMLSVKFYFIFLFGKLWSNLKNISSDAFWSTFRDVYELMILI